MNFIQFHQGEVGYPSVLNNYLGDNAPKSITAIGNIDILHQKTLALLCSVKCPGSLILRTYDLMQDIKEKGITIISGFHSPMEQECLTILLRGNNPIVICPARSIEGMRVRSEFRRPLEAGRLLFLSPFTKKRHRITVETSLVRNRFIAALADKVFVTHAEPHSKTEQFCREIVAWGKPLYTLPDNSNGILFTMGAKPLFLKNV